MTQNEGDYDDSFWQMFNLFHRKHNVRVEDFIEEWIGQYMSLIFFSLFRMTRKTFNKILDKINCEELNKYYSRWGQAIVAEKQLMMTLWLLNKGAASVSLFTWF